MSEYTYLCDVYRVRRLDRLSLVAEVYRDVEGKDGIETKWVQRPGYFGDWRHAIRSFADWLDESAVLQPDTKTLLKALDQIGNILSSLDRVSQLLNILEAPNGTTAEERIAFARKVFSSENSRLKVGWDGLPSKANPASPTPLEPVTSGAPKKRRGRPPKNAAVSATLPIETGTIDADGADFDW